LETSPRLRRTPRIIRSALFGILFSAAICLTVLGALYSLSDNPDRASQAYPILFFNLGLIVVLALYLGFRVWNVLFAQKVRRSAPLLHRRFVMVFSLAALVPAVLVGAFSSSLISQNFNNFFGDDVRDNLDAAYVFLNKYVTEELRDMSLEVVNTKRFLEVNRPAFEQRISYTAFLQNFARRIDVDAIYVLNREGVIYSRVLSPNSPELQIPQASVFNYIEAQGNTGFQTQDDIDYIVGLTKLQGYDDTFLLVGKYLKSNVGVLSSITGITDAKRSLVRYQTDQGWFQKVFFLTFLETASLILLAAIWLGITLANTVIEPLGRLVHAAEKVRGGDLTARVNVRRDWGEMSDLGSAFNRMTRQLSSQREDLIREHDVSEQRRQFSEAVLSGVTAGVIGLNQDGRITLMNKSAERLTGTDAQYLLDYPIESVFPEFSEAFQMARENIGETTEHQINVETPSGVRNFDLRVSPYRGRREDMGWVLTFDDMTRLVSAQRHSAWREVARRIAHEIKNPLTPIQLSAERLKRKYQGKIDSDPDVFDNCTDTIIRQVGSLEQMVNEFSTFARMPAPQLEPVNVLQLLEKLLFEQRVAFPDVEFLMMDELPGDIFMSCDERLISQAFTNIYKNAALSIATRIDQEGRNLPDGEVSTLLSCTEDTIKISISDNGPGWPLEDKDRLMEPYVTTRDTGTGLGLPIVKRIIDDHSGDIILLDRPAGMTGAQVDLILPRLINAKDAGMNDMLKPEETSHEI